MSKHFITGAARSVTNSVERLIELRKKHPEWDDRPSEKALARELLTVTRTVHCSQATLPATRRRSDRGATREFGV